MADQYRFAPAVDDDETYADGTIVPHRLSRIERRLPDGTWEDLGYAELHLHRVTRDDRDREDISVGVTIRVNPKIPPVIRQP